MTGKGVATFDGSLISATQTLNSADVLAGGVNTADNLTATVNTAVTVTPTLSAIENLVLSNITAGSGVNLINATGYTSIENSGSTVDLVVSNINSTATALKISSGGTSPTFSYTTAAIAGLSDSATLTLSDVSGGTPVIAGVETLNVVSAGASNTIVSSSIGATSLVTSGSQNLALGTLSATTTVLNAAASTGTVSATLGAVVGATVTGGQGADTVTISAVTGNAVVNTGEGNDNIIALTNLTVTDTIDGGAGSADKLTITEAIANVLDGATAATTKISNIEQLEITDALAGTLILANISSAIDTVNLTVTGAALMAGDNDTITANATSLTVNLGGTAATTNSGVLGGALAVTSSGTGTTDALSLNNKAIDSTTKLNLNVFAGKAITSTGNEAVSLNTGAVASGAAQTTGIITINADVATSPTSYTVAGTNALTTSSLVTNSTGLLTVNAAGMTAQPAGTKTLILSATTSGTAGTQNITGSNGDDTITVGIFATTISGGAGDDSITGGTGVTSNLSGGDGNDTLIGSSVNDVISGGNNNDSITSGTGNDNLTGGDGNDTFVLGSSLTAADTIDGGAGTNHLSIIAATTTASSIFANVTNIQEVGLTGTGSVTLIAPLSSSVTTFDLSEAGINNLTLAAGFTGAVTVLETNGTATNYTVGTTTNYRDVITNSANVALTVRGNANAMSTVQVVGGTGVDTLVITADSGTASLVNTSGIEAITMVAGATATATAAITNAVVATTKTLTVDASAMTNASATFGFAGATTQLGGVNVTGATSAANTITLTNFAGANSVTGGSAADSITSGTGTDSLAGGAGSDAYIFDVNLLNTDVVSDSAGAADTLNATVSGLTATTGALSISGVETLNIATGSSASTINAAGIVGATNINVNGASSVTLTNLPAGTNLGLGTTLTANIAAVGGYAATTTFGLADSSGATDAITVNLRGAADGNTAATLVAAAGIETVTIAGGTFAGTLNVTGVVTPTMTVTGGATGKLLNLSGATLNAATTTFNAPAFLGQLKVSGSATATTFTASGAEAHSITGGSGNDSITLNTVGTAVQTVAGGTGTDTLNMTLNDTSFSLASVSAVENINLTLGNNSAHSPGSAVGGFNDAALVNINVTGGNTLSTYGISTNSAIGSGTAFKTFNASGVSGVVDVVIAEAGMVLGASITGGSGTTDVVRFTDTTTANTAVTLSGFEKLVVTSSTDDTGGISLTNATGLTSVDVVGPNSYALTGLPASGVAINVGTTGAAFSGAKSITGTLTTATGTADALTFNLLNTHASNTTTLVANGIETITINESATVAPITTMNLAIQDTNATNPVVVNVTGGKALAFVTGTAGVQDITLVSGALQTNVSTLNASTFAGNLQMASGSRTGTTAMTITGGTGTDMVIMKNANDVMDGGTGTDTLNLVALGSIGGFLVDLSSTTDQVTSYNGSANGAIQKGFENVNLSGVTGTFGADVTARTLGSTITGTPNVDLLTGGAGADVFVYNQNGTTAGSLAGTTAAILDLIDGDAGTADAIQLDGSAAHTIPNTLRFQRITNVEKITSAINTNAVSITLVAASTANTAFNFIDLSGDTSGTGVNVISVTGAGGISSITGSAGIDQITLGALATAVTVTGGAGADTLSVANVSQTTVADSDGIDITVSAATVSLITTTTALTATTITGGSGVDTITLAGGVVNTATIVGAAGNDVINLGALHTGAVSYAILGATAATDGTDSITNFIIANDIIRIVDTAADVIGTSTLGYASGAGTALGLGAVALAAANVIVVTDTQTQSAAGIQTLMTLINTGAGSNIGNGVFIVSAAGGDANIWYDATLAGDDCVLVATLVGVNLAALATLANTNFVVA